jgi:SSS family solute:Na+ symporter
MHFIDWILILLPLLAVLAFGVITHRYMKSVSDFLSGGRLAGRYLLAVARGELQAGAAVFVAIFEVIRLTGFTMTWWMWIQTLFFMVVAISGFVVYRYRETRALTLAQFFEIRYSKKFRLFTGGLAFLAGILNFGIIPAVGARFFVYFLQLPEEMVLWGATMPTYVVLMGAFLSVTLFLTLSGGMITLMVTDCVEGMLSQLFYLAIITALLMMFQWHQISDVLTQRPPGESLLNPFDSHKLADFNLGYVLMTVFVTIYGTMAWQNSSAYNSAAVNAHESRMGGVLGRWREMGKSAVVTLLAVCAMTWLQHPSFAADSAGALDTVNAISDASVRSQMTIPVALSHMLPIGIKGLLCAILLMGVFGGDATHLHSWGGIFVQDIIVPLRKKPMGPRQHILALRLSVTGVALFAFFFGWLFRQTEYIAMWFQVTTAIYVGGAGAAIIGGLYWKKGTTQGAWAALLTGSLLSGGGILARQALGTDFPLNGNQISFCATILAIIVYVTVSLMTHRRDFDLDRMLHRGVHAVETGPQVQNQTPTFAEKLIGVDRNFSKGDRWIATGLFAWGAFWVVVLIVGSVWNMIDPWPVSWWSGYWHVAGIGVPVLIAFVTGIWFTWGGIKDIRELFRKLKTHTSSELDDGTVVGHKNLDEAK